MSYYMVYGIRNDDDDVLSTGYRCIATAESALDAGRRCHLELKSHGFKI